MDFRKLMKLGLTMFWILAALFVLLAAFYAVQGGV
jgi:hypothetical protein